MSSVVITEFRGQASKSQKMQKPNVFAEKSINTNLQDGALSAYPCPEAECSESFDIKDFLIDGLCGCTSFDKNTYVDKYMGRRYLVNSDSSYSQYIGESCDQSNDKYMLGMPPPQTEPSINIISEDDDTFSPKLYIYTFVSKREGGCTVESPPSPIASSAVSAREVEVSGFDTPQSGYGVTHIRIYRFDAGWKSGSESSVENNSGALLVGELDLMAGDQSFIDNGSIDGQEMTGILTYDMESMPSNPSGIGVTAFSVFSWLDDELFISIDGMPELRGKHGRFCFDDRIITARYWNNSIYVFTEKYNYKIDEVPSNGGVSYSNPPFRFENIAPISNEFSVSTGNSGVFYQSSSGVSILTQARSGGQSGSIGTGILNTSQWKSYQDKPIRTFVYNQFLFIFCENWNFTHLFEFGDGIFAGSEYSNHTIYPYSISAMNCSSDGEAYFSSGDTVYRFVEANYIGDSSFCEVAPPICEDCCPYDWQIMPSHQVKITDYSTVYLRIDPQFSDVTFRLWDRGCGGEMFIVYETVIRGCAEHEFRLPSQCLSQEHVVQLTGCAKVYELRMGTSSKDMGLNQ